MGSRQRPTNPQYTHILAKFNGVREKEKDKKGKQGIFKRQIFERVTNRFPAGNFAHLRIVSPPANILFKHLIQTLLKYSIFLSSNILFKHLFKDSNAKHLKEQTFLFLSLFLLMFQTPKIKRNKHFYFCLC